jgi:O-antigen ligase
MIRINDSTELHQHAGGWLAIFAVAIYASTTAILPDWRWQALFLAPVVLLPAAVWILGQPGRWILALIAVALTLPPLPIQIGNSGPHVALVIALAGVWVGLLRIREWRLQQDPVGWACLCWQGTLVLSLAPAVLLSGVAVAAGSGARIGLILIAVYAYLFLVHGPGRSVSLRQVIGVLWASVFLSAAFALLDFYFQFPTPAGFGPQFIWLESGVFRRAQGVFYEAGTMGNLCTFALVMCGAIFLQSRIQRVLPAALLWLLAIPSAAALIFTYSRGALLNLAASALVLLWLHRKDLPMARIAIAAGVALLVAIGFVVPLSGSQVSSFADAWWLRVIHSAEFFAEAPDAVLSGRLETWRIVLDYLAGRPWLLLTGVGYKTLAYSDLLGNPLIVDNAYLSALAETGVLGLTALVALNIAILKQAYRAARSTVPMTRMTGAWIFAAWMGECVQMFSSDVLTFWRVLPCYFILLAIAVRGRHAVDS